MTSNAFASAKVRNLSDNTKPTANDIVQREAGEGPWRCR